MRCSINQKTDNFIISFCTTLILINPNIDYVSYVQNFGGGKTNKIKFNLLCTDQMMINGESKLI